MSIYKHSATIYDLTLRGVDAVNRTALADRSQIGMNMTDN